jgi:hypothetical protein
MEMETAFDTCKCSNDDKVVYARSMLKADATYWWEMESGGKPSEMAKSTTWEKFVARFKARFCPMSATRKLEEEFLRLEQGNMTVQEYTTKFMEKARFAEIYVPTEERRIEKYVWGLKGNIREFVMTRNPMTFEAAIDMAELTEREKNRQIGERAGDKRKWDGSKYDSRNVSRENLIIVRARNSVVKRARNVTGYIKVIVL